jgi:hypothetical protein
MSTGAQRNPYKLSGDKDMRRLLKNVMAQGFHVSKSSGQHIRVTCPNGKTVFTSATPSDHRVLRNFRSVLKKNGADV